MKKALKAILRPYWFSLKNAARKVNQLILKPIRALPFSSEVFGPPQGYYTTVLDWLNLSSKGGRHYQEIYPQTILKREPPQTIEPRIHWKFTQEYAREIPSAFLAVVPYGRLWVNRGKTIRNSVVITPDDRILGDLSLEFGKAIQDNLIFEKWKLPPIHFLKGNVASLTSTKGEIYFHWIFDLLPKLELLKLGGVDLETIDYFVVNSVQSEFQKQSLSSLGIPAKKIIESTRYPHIKAEKLFAPSLPSLPGNPPQWVCQFLRQSFIKQVNPDLPSCDRLYISRKTARYRRVLNEEKVWEFLQSLGFKTIKLEGSSIEEQAAIFNQAKVIIAPHGAGLTNLVFCASGTKVVEIYSPNYVNVCYYSLCQELGLDYYYFLGEGKQPPEGIDPHIVGDDIQVDLDKLKNIIEMIGL
ncbi:MAG: glycosyltransferase family 61 protein [Jaaginema sp. PMC 1079.18]|nr:glycosyltransferase family 61 protein [Jaaginema sp. PMC 1080.18]MEC4850635.1 glycosyltransferase family 61 protein [Jaaginema sp. PMC 1079.18]MEC4866305.1 glycosyltransferase family 61 protein [Jaaginema sp. PMC 1078.18]